MCELMVILCTYVFIFLNVFEILTFRVLMEISLVLMKTKECLGLSLIHSWTEAIRLPLHQYLACHKIVYLSVWFLEHQCVREKGWGVAKHPKSQLSGSVTDGR